MSKVINLFDSKKDLKGESKEIFALFCKTNNIPLDSVESEDWVRSKIKEIWNDGLEFVIGNPEFFNFFSYAFNLLQVEEDILYFKLTEIYYNSSNYFLIERVYFDSNKKNTLNGFYFPEEKLVASIYKYLLLESEKESTEVLH